MRAYARRVGADLRFADTLHAGETGDKDAGAEGATAPETLRQKDRISKERLERGRRRSALPHRRSKRREGFYFPAKSLRFP